MIRHGQLFKEEQDFENWVEAYEAVAFDANPLARRRLRMAYFESHGTLLPEREVAGMIEGVRAHVH